jgi:uncharacterized membrane protein
MAPDRRSDPLANRPERGHDLGGEPEESSRLHAVLAYALAGFSGIILLAWKKEDRFVQFHALQSVGMTVVALGVGFGLWLFSFFPLLGFLYGMLLRVFQFGLFLLWLFLLWQAYRGRWTRLPYLGVWATRHLA